MLTTIFFPHVQAACLQNRLRFRLHCRLQAKSGCVSGNVNMPLFFSQRYVYALSRFTSLIEGDEGLVEPNNMVENLKLIFYTLMGFTDLQVWIPSSIRDTISQYTNREVGNADVITNTNGVLSCTLVKWSNGISELNRSINERMSMIISIKTAYAPLTTCLHAADNMFTLPLTCRKRQPQKMTIWESPIGVVISGVIFGTKQAKHNFIPASTLWKEAYNSANCHKLLSRVLGVSINGECNENGRDDLKILKTIRESLQFIALSLYLYITSLIATLKRQLQLGLTDQDSTIIVGSLSYRRQAKQVKLIQR